MCARDFHGRCTSALARAPFVSYKSVTFARNRLYESRPLYVFSQRLPNLANGSIDAMLGIVENILAPQALDNLLPAHHLPIFFKQQDEQFHGNSFDFQQKAVAAQFKTRTIEFKIAEFVGGRGHDAPTI